MSQDLIKKTDIAPDLTIFKLLNGMWQVSGAHGPISPDNAIKSMDLLVDNGFITWDLADHYGSAEDFVKIFREKRIADGKEESLGRIKFFTKWVPRPQTITRKVVEQAIDISRKRMGMEILDMVQFHWWEYSDKNYIKAIEFLDDLRQDGLIAYLGLTNFDTIHLEEFENMGIKIVSNQVQYSVIDRRPEKLMQDFCKKNNIKLLVYGTLGGGLLSERYLNKSEPSYNKLNTASLYKYKKMIDTWGDWSLFQKLLTVLTEISKKYGVSIANVAVRYVLENPVVAGAIIGVRLGVSEHIQENLEVFDFHLDSDDLQKIDHISNQSHNLIKIIGDCGDEYR
jgi:aryl-alcohol dehydrogenase-like predicted oxidoreductase